MGKLTGYVIHVVCFAHKNSDAHIKYIFDVQLIKTLKETK